jgi:hypothetical protein
MSDKLFQILTTRVSVAWCPVCIAKLDTATSPFGKRPSPGDYSVCLKCLHVLRFTDTMQVRTLTDNERRELDGAPAGSDLARIRAVIASVQKGRGG